MSKVERPARRMLLVASVGVAAVSYLAACEKSPAAGNLTTAPTLDVPLVDAGPPSTATVPPQQDAAPPAPAPTPPDVSPTGGNLMAPTPTASTPVPTATPTATPTAKPTPPKHPTGGNLMAPRPKPTP